MVVVKEQGNVYATILPPQGVEVIVLVATASKGIVPLQVVQVRPLKGLTMHLIKITFEVGLCDNLVLCSSEITTYPDLIIITQS